MKNQNRASPRPKNVEVSDNNVFNSDKQAIHIFAEASHENKCYQARASPESLELKAVLNEFTGVGLPADELASRLLPYLNGYTRLTQDNYLYIQSCEERYKRGIPIHLGKLLKCQTRIEEYFASYSELSDLGIIDFDDYGWVNSVNVSSHLTPKEEKQWPKEVDGSFTFDKAQLKELNIPLAQQLYQALTYEVTKPLLNFRVNLSGYHQFYPNPFAASSGREAPKGNSFIYLPKDVRNYLLSPKPGTKIFVLDFAAQEVAVLAALSGDDDLWSAYQNGDLYLELIKRSQLFSQLSRQQFKILCISHMYGMTTGGIKKKFSVSHSIAKKWYHELRYIFQQINEYLDLKVTKALAQGYAEVNGYRRSVAATSGNASIRNFFVQALCAQILQKISVQLDQLNIKSIFAIHDSISIVTDLNDDKSYDHTIKVMEDVSESFLGSGYRLRVECEFIKENNIGNK